MKYYAGRTADPILQHFIAAYAKAHPLLSREEEIELGRRIVAGTMQRPAHKPGPKRGDGTSAYSNPTGDLNEDAREAQRTLVEANLCLGMNLAKRYAKVNPMLQFDDLMQEAVLGLYSAARMFNPELGFRFTTYASHWIIQKLTRYRNDRVSTVRVPAATQCTVQAKRARGDVLTQGEQEMLRCMAIAHAAHLPIEDPERLADFSYCDDPDEFDSQDDTEHLRTALTKLPERSRRIVIAYYGLDTGEARTLEDVGQEFGLTRERIRQIINEARLLLLEHLNEAA